MVTNHPDSTEAEQRETYTFRRTTLMTYLQVVKNYLQISLFHIFVLLQCLDGRANWSTLISAFRILVESSDDKLYIVYNGGLQIVFEVYNFLQFFLF